MRKIGIAIPNYNRFELLFDSFSDVINDERVEQVTIVDDQSEESIYKKVEERATKNKKIKLFRNEANFDCYRNKYASLAFSTNDWNILLDSDNKISYDYLYRLFQIENWQEGTAYLPSFAAPHFNYTKYEGLLVTKENVRHYMDDATFATCLNTANFFVNKHFYMKCWDGSVDPITADSIYMNYLYLKNGGKLYIVPGLTYQHRVDNHGTEQAGHYVTHQHKTVNFHQEVLQKLKDLR